MCKEVVEWLRDHARKMEHFTPVKWMSKPQGPVTESEFAAKFADEIERLFVLPEQLRPLLSTKRKLEGVTMVTRAPVKKVRRSRRP
jgi:hypothetical protein